MKKLALTRSVGYMELNADMSLVVIRLQSRYCRYDKFAYAGNDIYLIL